MTKKVVIVTGASSGIGKAIADALSQNGMVVYGLSRNIKAEDHPFQTRRLDVADESMISSVLSDIHRTEGQIDVLINNAGSGIAGPFETTDLRSARAQFEVNFFGLAAVCRAVIPHMRQQGKGQIINVGSIGGVMGMPFQSYYSASKFAVEGLSQAMRMELRGHGIKVHLVLPGDIRTDFTDNREFTTALDDDNPYRDQFAITIAKMEEDERGGGQPSIVSRKVVALVTGKRKRFRSVTAIFSQRLAVSLQRILPYGWFEKILLSHFKIK